MPAIAMPKDMFPFGQTGLLNPVVGGAFELPWV